MEYKNYIIWMNGSIRVNVKDCPVYAPHTPNGVCRFCLTIHPKEK